MNLNSSSRKKVRWAKRKCKAMVNSINELTSNFPEVNLERGYWHIHMPGRQEFIDSVKTPSKARKICIQALIDRVKYLIKNKPDIADSTRVVACISLSNLKDSQIIVFFGDSYFESFLNRDTDDQKWIPLPSIRTISKEFNLEIPMGLTEKGYREELIDEGFKSTSELWFVWGAKPSFVIP